MSDLLPKPQFLLGNPGTVLPNGSATIANGQTDSSVISQNGMALAGILFPAAFTGATVTFKASIDGTNFFPVYNSAGLISYTAGTSRYLAVNASDFQGIQYLKIVSASAEGALRTLNYSLKGL